MFFVDETIIKVKSGNGGAGCVSFRREKYIPFGGPNGGDGGDGGSVIFRVKENVRTLYDLKRLKNFYAKNGTPGMGSQMNGKAGDNVYIDVPPGTALFDFNTGDFITDLLLEGDEFLLLSGGKGGLGNMHFKTSTNQAPRYAQPGLPGSEMKIKVELKLIADVGLVGFPNAGKSTLLSIISDAKPKIANYPFTTLIPNLGVFKVEYETFVMADIPGIIEGASSGVGLGIEFLKHIERTKLLLFIVDLESEDFENHFNKLRKEIKIYSEALYEKPFLIAASKFDLHDGEFKIELLEKEMGLKDVIPFSGVTKFGIDNLLYKLKDKIHEIEGNEGL